VTSREAIVTMKIELEPSAELTGLLQEIRDRMPARAAAQDSPPGGWPAYWAQRGGGEFGATTAATPGAVSSSAAGKSNALYALLVILDGWIEGIRENHDALGHRGESRGDECWRQFAPEDIRRMVNDAARAVGITKFPYPKIPKEDTL
jgi:hypothetical protein